MSKTDTITQDRLKELLHYNPATGEFTWLQRTSNRIHIGDVAGTPDLDGYIIIGIDGVGHKAHRLAFLYMEAYIPEQVDHGDHVTDNNKWKNLNLSTNQLNKKNQKLRCTNTSGTCGVYWNIENKKWQAYIRADNKQVYLGYFSRKRDAISAREAANIKYKFHKNHGKKG